MSITTRDASNHARCLQSRGASNHSWCQHQQAMRLIAGICRYSHHTWLPASNVAAGVMCDCWHHIWLPASYIVAGIVHCWHHIFRPNRIWIPDFDQSNRFLDVDPGSVHSSQRPDRFSIEMVSKICIINRIDFRLKAHCDSIDCQLWLILTSTCMNLSLMTLYHILSQEIRDIDFHYHFIFIILLK